MLDLLFFLLVSILAALLGAAILRISSVKLASRLEEALLYLPLGYLAMAYLIALLGLMGLLTTGAMVAMLGGVLLLGLAGARPMWASLVEAIVRAQRALSSSPHRWLYRFLLLWAIMMLLEALVWPDSSDFDGVAEHLAMAKLWVQAGQVRPLWFMHHSQFPATLQMLYALALLFRGPVAAKLFHFAYGMMAVTAVFLLTRRHISAAAAPWAAVVLATTPVFAWLCGVAYADLGVLTYVLLAVHFFLCWLSEHKLLYIVLAGILAGAAMAVKMQGIAYFGVILLIAAYVAWRGPRPQRARAGQHIAVFALVGAMLASPWYVKSWIITGNPVYPFAYSVFGGKQWSVAQAEWYQRHQRSFGIGELPSPQVMKNLPWWKRSLVGPREPHKLLLSPVNLTLWPWEFTVPVGKLAAVARMSIGPLYLIFVPALLIFAPRPPNLKILLILFALDWVWWLYSMQLTRYLLPALALLAPAAGYGIYRSINAGVVLRLSARVVVGLWLVIALLFNVLAFSPALLAIFGVVSWDSYLRKSLGVYAPSQYINEHTPPNAKVITYGEPRCFYLDREYLWGDWHYHQMIIYDKMKEPEELITAYRRLGITHILINQTYFQDSSTIRLLRGASDRGYVRKVRSFGPPGRYVLLETIN